MNPRLALYELAHRHSLDGDDTRALFDAAGLTHEPPALQRWLWPAVAILGAALGGLGVILWIAANWDTLGRVGRFALLQGLVGVMALGAAWRPALRAPLGLLALLGTGGLFAYFGQTYQTGADAWQLFALWAALTLPLCLGARSDVLWAPWALVMMTGISLWTFAHTGHRWRVEPNDMGAYALAWGASAAVVLALSPALARFTGAGPWAMRTAATLTVMAITLSALGSLFSDRIAAHYPLGLLVLGGAAAGLSLRRFFDVFALSAVALGINVLLICGLARLLFDDSQGDPIGRLLLTGLIAAGLLAASVSAITKLSRHHAREDAT